MRPSTIGSFQIQSASTGWNIAMGGFFNQEGDVELSIVNNDSSNTADWVTNQVIASDGAYVFVFHVAADGTVAIKRNDADMGAALVQGSKLALQNCSDAQPVFPSAGGALYALEFIVWETATTGAQDTALAQNIAAYYGITLT